MPEDYVDQVLEQWRVERPDLRTGTLGVVSRILRLASHLRIADERVLAEHGLASWSFEVLSALRRQGPPFTMSPTELRRATLLTSGAMTNRLDRLEEAGLLARQPDPVDRRGILVRLTEEGRWVLDEALEHRLASAARLLEPLTGSEQQELADLLRRLLAPLSSRAPGVTVRRAKVAG